MGRLLSAAVLAAAFAKAQVPDAVAEELPPMQAAHEAGGAVVLDGNLWVYNGYTNSGGPGADRTLALEAYDPISNAWSRMADCPVPRNSPGSFELDGRIFQVAGEGPRSGQFSSDAYWYDPASDSWSAFADFPSLLWEPRRAVVNGRAFLIGGRHGYTRTYEHTYECDFPAGAWNQRADMPYSVKSVATVAWNGKVHLFGGEHKEGEPQSEWVRHFQIYDVAADAWDMRADAMPWLLRSAAGVLACGDQAYLYAESVWDDASGSWVPNDLIYRYTFTTDAWDVWARLALPAGMRAGTATPVVFLDGQAYLTQTKEDGARSPRPFRFRIEPPGPPADVGNALRVRKEPSEPVRTVHLDWGLVPAPAAWQEYQVLRGDLSQLRNQPFPGLTGRPGLRRTAFNDTDAAGALWFYDVRGSDCFGTLSAD